MDILQDLEYRGLLYQLTDRDGLDKELKDGPVTLYCGFDPTADSLHIGNLMPILCLRRFQVAGHRPLALVGGATGLIGDPSGKANERTLNGPEIVQQWTDKIRGQLERFLDFEGANAAKVVNNYDWTGELDVVGFLRDIGKNFSLNYMLAKESVQSRLSTGISFTEFSYMILQSNDFKELNKTYGCKLQVGGSDQWGNITAGMELIGRTSGERAYGLTIPLVTKSDGTKFGKTESGTIWLDAEKTSPYQFYQFWINTDDQDVVNFLKYFTFRSPEEIEALAEQVRSRPEERAAQRQLAREVTAMVHGQEAVERAEKISEVLFNGNIRELTGVEIAEAFSDVPSTELAAGEEIGLVDLVVASGAASSKRQARQDIESGAVYVNGERVNDLQKVVIAEDRIDGKYLVLRRGKKKYFMVKFV